MKTIKRERQVRLDGLITFIIKNEVISSVFVSNRGNKTIVDIKGNFSFFGVFNQNDLFTITEEAEITEDTVLDVILVYDEYSGNINHVGRVFKISINQIIKINNDGNIKFIYLQNPDGSIGELIWKDGELVD